MKKHQLIPLVVFCVLFLLYTLYFVKVINQTRYVEPDSIAKTIKRSMEAEEMVEEKDEVEAPRDRELSAINREMLAQPRDMYISHDWLNVRQEPTLASRVVEKVLMNERVSVLGSAGENWSYVETLTGKRGYVASRYLSGERTEEEAEKVEAPTDTTETPETTPDVAGAPTIYDVPIISYHHISDNTDAYSAGNVLPAVNLTAQLDYLIANGFSTVTFYDLRDAIDGVSELPKKPVILTFNGGYADAYEASQHLNGKGLKGTFFVTTDMIGEEGFLDWRQVKKMRDWGMEIGSMGKTGAALAGATDYYLEQEIMVSKEAIEKQIGEEIVSFAYSQGSYSQAAIDMVKAAGYRFARTADSGSRFSDRELYTLPTLRVFFPAGANQFRVWLGQ